MKQALTLSLLVAATALVVPAELLAQRSCGTPDAQTRALMYGDPAAWEKILGSTGTDCSAGSTTPGPEYDPGDSYLVDVWVHIITNSTGTTGNISDAMVHSQIQILNEDFRALLGTNGENGTDSRIYFRLATEDESGNPASGITRSANTTWFNDGGAYYNTLHQDPNRFMNIYTNDPGGGTLGYVPFLPADGGGSFVGGNSDRVVILWSTFGRDAPDVPFDQGRTATHEVGHYLGLEHTFSGSCGTPSVPGCYTTGDLICDTPPTSAPYYGCGADQTSCSGVIRPKENYMDYSDDLCMEQFTVEQTRRVRCSLENWRPNLGTPVLFYDGFESGDFSEWSEVI